MERKMSREHKYLGKYVPGEHLEKLSQVRELCKVILHFWRTGKITYKKAMDELVFLENFVIKRDTRLKSKKKAKEVVRGYIEKLKCERR